VAIAFVNSTTGNNDGGASSLPATAANHTAGNLLVVGVIWTGATTANVPTDTAGNAYVSTTQKATSGGNDHCELFYAKNITGNAANIVTANFSGSSTFRRIMVFQYSGCDTTAPYTTGEGGQATDATGTTHTTSSFTTATADSVICTFAGGGNVVTWSAGAVGTARVTGLGTDSGGEDNIVSATGTYTGSMNTNVNDNTWITAAAFKIAGGGGGGPVAKKLAVLGVGG
jgi:hypothetical protein